MVLSFILNFHCKCNISLTEHVFIHSRAYIHIRVMVLLESIGFCEHWLDWLLVISILSIAYIYRHFWGYFLNGYKFFMVIIPAAWSTARNVPVKVNCFLKKVVWKKKKPGPIWLWNWSSSVFKVHSLRQRAPMWQSVSIKSIKPKQWLQ